MDIKIFFAAKGCFVGLDFGSGGLLKTGKRLRAKRIRIEEASLGKTLQNKKDVEGQVDFCVFGVHWIFMVKHSINIEENLMLELLLKETT